MDDLEKWERARCTVGGVRVAEGLVLGKTPVFNLWDWGWKSSSSWSTQETQDLYRGAIFFLCGVLPCNYPIDKTWKSVPEVILLGLIARKSVVYMETLQQCSQEGLSVETELDDFTKKCVPVWKPEVGVYTQLVPGKKVRKIRTMRLNLCCSFTGGVSRKRVRIGNWWKRGWNRSPVAQSLGFRLFLGKRNSAFLFSVDLLLMVWIRYVLVPLLLLLCCLPCLNRQHQSQWQSLRAVICRQPKTAKPLSWLWASGSALRCIWLITTTTTKPIETCSKRFSYIL